MTKQLLKKLLINTPGFRALCRSLTRDHVRVFMYHRFTDQQTELDKKIGIDNLDEQLSYVSRHHGVLSCDEHVSLCRSNAATPDCPVVFTIDDGYADVAELAVPLFEKYNVPVTIFLVTNFIDGKIWFWWDKLRYMLDQFKFYPMTVCLFPTSNDTYIQTIIDKESGWNSLSDTLIELSDTKIREAIDNLAKQLDITIPDECPNTYRPMTWETIIQLESDNVTFGPHTANHPRLTLLTETDIQEELVTSIGACGKLEHPSSVFCYPFGTKSDYVSEIFPLVEKVGFEGAYVAHEQVRNFNYYSLPRYSATNDYTEFHWKLCGAAYLFSRFFARNGDYARE